MGEDWKRSQSPPLKPPPVIFRCICIADKHGCSTAGPIWLESTRNRIIGLGGPKVQRRNPRLRERESIPCSLLETETELVTVFSALLGQLVTTRSSVSVHYWVLSSSDKDQGSLVCYSIPRLQHRAQHRWALSK